MLRSGARLLPFALGVLVAGCGLRSDPEAPLICAGDDGSGTDTGGEARAGGCDNPIELPYFTPVTVRGRLGGCSEATGWCAADLGPEDVYLFKGQTNAFDVVVSFDASETTISPTLRIVQDDGSDPAFDPCDAPPVANTEVCAPEADSRDTWSFNGAGGEYYLIVDSAGAGGAADYAFDIAYGKSAVPNDCPKMADNIVLGSGGAYQWDDTLPRDQGYIDSHCHAPGSEHTWTVQLKSPGLLSASVQGQGGLEPVLSIRTGCAGNTELACDNSTSSSGTAKVAEFLGAGTYVLSVDQQSVTGGGYSLTVTLD